jgi:hypothetical protein
MDVCACWRRRDRIWGAKAKASAVRVAVVFVHDHVHTRTVLDVIWQRSMGGGDPEPWDDEMATLQVAEVSGISTVHRYHKDDMTYNDLSMDEAE